MKERAVRGRPLYLLLGAFWKSLMREPQGVIWTFLVPLLLALVLAAAFREEQDQQLAIGVADTGPEAAELVARLTREAHLRPVLVSPELLREKLRRREVSVGVLAGPPIELWAPDTLESKAARALLREVLGLPRPENIESSRLSQAALPTQNDRYIDFLFPGLLGLTLLSSSLSSVTNSILEARRSKLLKQLSVTPTPRGQYLLSLLLGRLSLGVVEIVFFTGAASLLFSVPVQGSIVALGAFGLLSCLAFSGMAMLIAARITSPEVAGGVISVIQLPMMLLSGVFFAADQFPTWTQGLIQVLPLTVVNDGLRAIMLEGASLRVVAQECAVLGAWSLGTFAMSLRFFRWG